MPKIRITNGDVTVEVEDEYAHNAWNQLVRLMEAMPRIAAAIGWEPRPQVQWVTTKGPNDKVIIVGGSETTASG
jgi:hypothetical protein